ncbi:Zn-dependent hydrolase [Marinobacterium nitratireducens]|uniref:Zn-dependent hydrolase n=1 Tax=Marinobacterium nitratireducens TaxID=518897 RepID=A0A917ZFY9_9GAMM|nr:M20 family metallo-hydrolase [Marinobacterium nitratireducens]GGO81424.1 Zn-dependent hydrolase [Marinobacterium nitratireducens]
MPVKNINAQRIWNTLMEMGEIGATEAGGSCRLALTELDRQGRDLFVQWCRDAGCEIGIDRIGNIYARRPGTDPDALPISTGSHLDTQPTGGKFDGIYGCLAGLEVIRTLNDEGIETRRPVEVVIWTNEEGSRFAPAMVASGVYSGKFTLDYALNQTDAQGIRLGDALKTIGYDGDIEVGARRFAKFFELHIEQGPVLEREDEEVGVVTGVLGMRWYDVKVKGVSAHAGPTPMSYRKDALGAAARMITAMIDLASERADEDGRCTVGELHIPKGSRNVIPGDLNFTLDLRNATLDGLEAIERDAMALIDRIAAETGVEVAVERIWDSPPIAFDAECVAAVEKVVAKSGYSYRRMTSGAGHDAVNISQVAPTSMIFVPSVGGISHNEAEYSTPEQIAAGAQILFEVMRDEALA